MFDTNATARLFLRHLRMNRFKLRPGGDTLMHKKDKTLENSINYIRRSYIPTFVFFVPYSKLKSATITPRPEKEKIAKLSPDLC